MTSRTNIALTPDFVAKRERIATLRNEVASLYELRDNMLTYEQPKLIAFYTTQIGQLKYEEYALEVEVRKLKRQMQLAQAAVNRGEQPNVLKINRIVEDEFAVYQEQLEAQLESIKASQEYLASPILTKEDADEMKHIYKVLVKRLHPDWNPNLPQDKADLFVRAQAAYKMCNLHELRNILLMLDGEDTPLSSTIEEADAEITTLEQSVAQLKKRIKEIEEAFPFTLQDKLYDEKWVEQEQTTIKQHIAQLTEEKDKWSLFVSSLFIGNNAEA